MDQVGYYKYTMEENTFTLDFQITNTYWIVPLSEITLIICMPAVLEISHTFRACIVIVSKHTALKKYKVPLYMTNFTHSEL